MSRSELLRASAVVWSRAAIVGLSITLRRRLSHREAMALSAGDTRSRRGYRTARIGNGLLAAGERCPSRSDTAAGAPYAADVTRVPVGPEAHGDANVGRVRGLPTTAGVVIEPATKPTLRSPARCDRSIVGCGCRAHLDVTCLGSRWQQSVSIDSSRVGPPHGQKRFRGVGVRPLRWGDGR